MNIEEIQENGLTYLVTTYPNGSVIKEIKQEPLPLPQEQRGKTTEEILLELQKQNNITQSMVMQLAMAQMKPPEETPIPDELPPLPDVSKL